VRESVAGTENSKSKSKSSSQQKLRGDNDRSKQKAETSDGNEKSSKKNGDGGKTNWRGHRQDRSTRKPKIEAGESKNVTEIWSNNTKHTTRYKNKFSIILQ
jgi:hypothetical protein